ncbi:MAG: SRPBCC domain-containing protein, partial [Opitutales bacterium]
MNPTPAQPIDLTIIRAFRAPRDRVFAYFTIVENLKRWYGPEACQVTSGELDFREGGAYRLEMQAPMGLVSLKGHYTSICPPEHLAFTFQWADHPEMNSVGMQVRIDLEDSEDGGTRLRLVQSGFETTESRDNHHDGWNGTFDRLLMETHSDARSVQAELEALLRTREAAIVSRDAGAAVRGHAEDIRVFDIGSEHRGRPAYEAMWEACFPYFGDTTRPERKEAQWTIAGDLAVLTSYDRLNAADYPCARSWLRT